MKVIFQRGDGLTDEERRFANSKGERWDCHNCNRQWLFIADMMFLWDREKTPVIWVRYKGEPFVFR